MLGKEYSLVRSVHRHLGTRLRTLEARSRAQIGNSLFTGEAEVSSKRSKDAIQVGDHCCIRGELLVFRHAGQIRIGDLVYIGPHSTIWSSSDGGVTIGNRVLISMNAHIHDTDSHPVDADERFRQTQAILSTGHPPEISGIAARAIRIGDDAWIGQGATILKGVIIGEGAIVGAMSVVVHDVPPYSVVAGNPAKVIGFAGAKSTQSTTP